MNDNKISSFEIVFYTVLFVVSVVLLIWVSYLSFMRGYETATQKFQKELIQRNIAEYNPTNGVWQYK